MLLNLKRLQVDLHHAGLTILLLIAAPFAASAQTMSPSKATTNASPQTLSDAFAEVAKSVEPAVVSIDTKGKMPEIAARQSAPNDSGDIMEFFRRQMQRRPVYAVGSGFIVDKSGYILTNLHVVEEAARITVKLDSGEEYPAKIVGSDEETDLAVLKIDAGKDLPYVKLGDSDKARVGEWVLAIGSPFGLNRTVTAGIVSQTRRETPQGTAFQKFIQTDAAINKGNSGGPLVNMNGEVIGVNSQIATSTGDYNGVGFALPSNEALNVYQQIVKSGKVRRGYLGVSLESVKPEFAKVYGLTEGGGAIVVDLRDKLSPAGRAGLQVGDVIVEFDRKKVDSAADLISRVAGASPDDAISLVYMREVGSTLERKTTEIRLGERPIPTGRSSQINPDRRRLGPENAPVGNNLGLTLSELTPSLASSYKLEGQKGVVIKEVNPESYVADVKISSGAEAFGEGDLIRRINRQAVPDMKAFNAIVSKLKPGDAVVMEVLTYNPSSRAPQLKIVQFTVQ